MKVNQLYLLIPGAYQAKTCEAANTTTSPPKKPSHDFLGEIRSNNLLLPIREPTKYAPVSFSQINTNIANAYNGVKTISPGVLGMEVIKFNMENVPAQYTWASNVNAQLFIGFGAL